MKKLLALVLALVMSMSLVTISNAAFKDADSIDYKEAVDVNKIAAMRGMSPATLPSHSRTSTIYFCFQVTQFLQQCKDWVTFLYINFQEGGAK